MGEVVNLHSPQISLDSELGRELVVDLARYAEDLLPEAVVRKKYRFDDDVWESLGNDDKLVEAIELEKIRRMRDGSTKRELAQKHIVRGPDILNTIMSDVSASPRHRVDAIKTLDSFTGNGAEAAQAADRFTIIITMNDHVEKYDKSISINANDVDPYNPQEKLTAIEQKKDDQW
jgi:hypothetical protein